MVCRMPRSDALGRFESIFCDISFRQLQGIFLTINMYFFISQSTQNFLLSVLFWVLFNYNDFLRSKKNFKKFFFCIFSIFMVTVEIELKMNPFKTPLMYIYFKASRRQKHKGFNHLFENRRETG